MHVWANFTIVWEYIFEISMWTSEGSHYPSMSSGNVRKMEKVCQYYQNVWCFTHWFVEGFHCLDHEMLITKLNAYGFSFTALKVVHNYLSNRKQRTKIDSLHSSLLGIIIQYFFNWLFFIIESTDIASYTNDNTPYVTADDIDRVI